MKAFSFAAAITDRGLTPTAEQVQTGYWNTVLSPNGGDGPVAGWRLGSTTAVVDAIGNLDGTFDGASEPELVSGLPEDSNMAVNFDGEVWANIPHDDILKLSAFTLSFWVRPNKIPTESEPNIPLFSKDNPTGSSGNNVDGDFFVSIVREGGWQVRFRTSGGNRDINTPTDIVEPGQKYHVVVRADDSGFDLHVNGVLLGSNSNYGGAWSTNTRDIVLAANAFFAGNADVVLDEIAIYDRVLSLGEILALAQITRAPVAEDDSASVQEGGEVTINVTENDTFVGDKADLTVTIEDDDEVTGAGDSVEVTPSNDIKYTAGSTDDEVTRSFTYKITDLLGTSNLATVRVTILDILEPPAPEGLPVNCYTLTTGDTVTVNSMSQLQSAVNNAPSTGRQVLIANGTYDGSTLTFTRSGSQPVVIRPEGNPGQVTINNCDWTINAGSSRLVIYGLYFNNPVIRINGSGHRVTRCRIRQVNRRCIQIYAATDTRIDHCDWADSLSNENPKNFVWLNHNHVGSGALKRVLVDHNYVHDSVPAVGINGSDLIGLSSSGAGAAPSEPGLIIHRNLFSNIALPSEGELVGAKCSGIVFQYNTLLNTNNCYINAPRMATKFTARSNWFENTTSRPLRVRSDDALIIGNRLVGSINIAVCNGDFYWAGSVGTGYPAARRARIIGNRLGSGRIVVGDTVQSDPPDVTARDCNLWGNTRDSGGDAHQLVAGWHTNTTFVEDDEEYTPAVKLTSSDVGMEAPDPLCPSGP